MSAYVANFMICPTSFNYDHHADSQRTTLHVPTHHGFTTRLSTSQ